MSEQEQEQERHATDESTDEPDVEAHLQDEFMRDDEMAGPQERGLQDEAL